MPDTRALRIYKTKVFARFARKAHIGDDDLWAAATNADAGHMDADLGGGVIKQRIARAGQGKSGGSRSIILLRRGHRAVFLYGYEKKDQANLSAADLDLFRELAPLYLNAVAAQINAWVKAGALLEINAEGDANG